MNIRLLSAFIFAASITVAVEAQSSPAPATSQSADQNSGQSAGQSTNPASNTSPVTTSPESTSPESGGGQGHRGGRGGYGGGMGGGAGMMMGRGLMGTVTEVATDHYTIKTEAGEVYTVHFTVDTRIFKQVTGGMRGPGQAAGAGGGSGGRGYGGGDRNGNLPQELKPTDIKAGDAIAVMGEVDATAKSANATRIAQLDPAVVEQMRAMQADFGKTWLMGKVTAIDGTKITLTGVLDNAPHSVAADENTTFRKRRDPITLADIQVGDTLRAEGAVKDGVFTAVTVNVFGMGGGETPTVPRGGAPQVPQSAPPQ